MPVRFIVDPRLPADVKVLTLAYTFFESMNTANIVSGDAPKPSEEQFYANAPKKGMFRLMPADSVAKCVWAAYHAPKTKLHYYVPEDIAWIDRIKGIAPSYMRSRIMKIFPALAARAGAAPEK